MVPPPGSNVTAAPILILVIAAPGLKENEFVKFEEFVAGFVVSVFPAISTRLFTEPKCSPVNKMLPYEADPTPTLW
jgi:hypothetical protein